MNRINFKLVHAFVAVAELRSFRRASEQLNRSQSGISLQIRELEDQLGVPLFHRTTRLVQLTAEGERLLQHARRAMSEWDSGLLAIRESADMIRGKLAIACIPTVADSRLPSILKDFVIRYPGIQTQVSELPSDDLLEAVRRHEVDFGIGLATAHSGASAFQPLAVDTIHVIGHRCFGLAGRDHLTVRELASLPVLMNARSTALRAELEAYAAAQGIALDIKHEVLHSHTALAFARAGLGVAVLPALALPVQPESDLVTVRLGSPAMTRTIGIVTNRGAMLSPAAARLRDTTIAAFAGT